MSLQSQTVPYSERKKTLVLFDVGGVLLKLNYGTFYEKASELSENYHDFESFKNAYVSSNIEGRSLEGTIDTESYFSALSDIISPEKRIDDEILKELITHCWKEPIDNMIELKKRVHDSGYPIGIASNISQNALDIIYNLWPKIFEVYDDSNPLVYSFEVGAMKPEPAMYKRLTGYDKIIFIDDKESYLKTGIDGFDWYGILFTEYVDENETIRAVHADKTQPSRNFKTANSISEVIEALKTFGVDI